LTYEGFQIFIYPLISLFAVFTVVFAVRTIFFIRRQEAEAGIDIGTKKVLIWVFGLIAVGYALWALAEIAWDIHSLFVEELVYSFVADPLWMIGYPFITAGFLYLSYTVYKSHKEKRKVAYWVGATVLVALFLYFLIRTYIIPFIGEEKLILAFVDLYYPIASAVAFVSALSALIFFRKSNLSTPMILLAVSLIFSFAGDMLYTYETWNELGYGVWGVLYDSFYALEYIAAGSAFYILSSKSGKTG